MRLLIAAGLAAAIAIEAAAQVPPLPPPTTPPPTPRTPPVAPAPGVAPTPTPTPWPGVPGMPGQSAEWREHERAIRELQLQRERLERELARSLDQGVRDEQLRVERELRALDRNRVALERALETRIQQEMRARELDQRAWERAAEARIQEEMRVRERDQLAWERQLRAEREAMERGLRGWPTPPPTPSVPPPGFPAAPTPPPSAPLAPLGQWEMRPPPSPYPGWERTPEFPQEVRLPQDPADTLYNRAQSLYARNQFRAAAEAFQRLHQRFPSSGYAPRAMYYEASSLYRIGGRNELEAALDVLNRQKQRFPNFTTPEPALETRIRGQLASRGDVSARNRVTNTAGQQGSACNRDQMSIRIEALNAVSRMTPDSVTPIIRSILGQRDECSERLRMQAILLLAKRTDAVTTDVLIGVIRNDPSLEVKRTAVQWLGEVPSERGIAALEEILRSSRDEALHSAALRAISNARNPRASQAIRSTIERADASEQIRRDAISALVRADSVGAAAYLRSVYPRLESPRLKETALTAIARLPGDENRRWLTDLVRNPGEPVAVRQSVLRTVTRSSTTTLSEIATLYSSVSELELKQQIISSLGDRKEPEVSSQLIDMYRRTSDTKLQLQIVNSLSRRNDPAARSFMLEILKPPPASSSR